jgi:hypothetical protein
MIRTYFDDSGTHEGSGLVLIAGIMGTEGRMDGLDRTWRWHLEAPLCGRKGRIKRFHAYDCYQSINDFVGWTRTETDYFRHQLREVIIQSGVSAYGIACLRRDYEDLIAGDLRSVLGDPEGFCINQCVVRSLAWVKANTFDPKVTFIFDNRPSPVRRYAGTVYDAFAQAHKPPPELTGYAFLSSMDVRPLQAADLIAWELYQFAKSVLVAGRNAQAHQEILHLQKKMDFSAQVATRDAIIVLRDYWLNYFKENPSHLKQMANHFSFFDPQNPDYSNLSDGSRP